VGGSTSGGTIDATSLRGNYSFQLAASHYNVYQASIFCPVSFGTGQNYNQWATTDKLEVTTAVATFDGAGNVSISGWTYGKFDQADSNAKWQLACNPDGSLNVVQQGYAQFFPPSQVTITGTYTLSPDGTGVMTLSVPGQTNNPTLIVRLAGGTKPASSFQIFGFKAAPLGGACQTYPGPNTSSYCSSDTAGSGVLQ
jgi:hypothetical protein